MSNLSAFGYIQERSQATPGLFNLPLSIISANIAALDSGLTSSSPSGNTFSFLTNIETSGGAHFQHLSIGSTPPSYATTAALTIEVNSAHSDYMYFVDSSAQKSSYVIGSRAGNLADGLNIWDASAGTMIASFSKQSIRFFQNVVGPVFDTGGALADTYNAATFIGSGSTLSGIQAAINQATIDRVSRVYLPASLYPYNAAVISFNTNVQMVREGGDWSVYDVIAYGAYGDGATDDTIAIQSALSYAPIGAIVRVPVAPGYASSNSSGCYIVSNLTIIKPVTFIGDNWGPTGRSQNIGGESQLTAATHVFFAGSRLRAKAGATGYMLSIGPAPSQYISYEGNLAAVRVDGLFLDGNARSPDVGAMRLDRVTQSEFARLKIEHFKREALYFNTSVSESVFDKVWLRFCGSADSGIPCIDLTDNDASVLEAHNLLYFNHLSCIFPMGNAVRLNTVSNKTFVTRDIFFHNSTFHGVIADVDGFPYTFTTSQKSTTFVQAQSARNIRFEHCHMVGAGRAPGAFFNLSVGSNTTGPGTIQINDVQMVGRYGTPYGSPLYGVWVQTGTLAMGAGTNIDASNTADVQVEAAGSFYMDNTVSAQSGNVVTATTANTIPMRLTFQGQTAVIFNNADATFQIGSSAAAGRTYNLVATGSGSGNISQGFYQYDTTGGFLNYSISSGGQLSWGTDGNTNTPALAFNSEHSLGLSRTATGVIRQSYGTFAVSALTADTGYFASAVTALNLTATSLVSGANVNLGASGQYRLGNIGIVYGDGANTFLQFPGAGAIYFRDNLANTVMRMDASSLFPHVSSGATLGTAALPWAGAFFARPVQHADGTALAPGLTFSSESSLGIYRSGTSTIALSYGTINLTSGGAVTSIASLTIKSGTNNSCGTAVLGSNGSVNVANTYVKTGDLIFLTDQTAGGTLGDLEIGGIRNSSGFTILSTSVTDTSTVAYLIIRPG